MTTDDSTKSSSPGSETGVNIPVSMDNPRLQITIVKLNGQNFLIWAQSARMYIAGRGKIGYLTGDAKEPESTDTTYSKWYSENSLVMSWLVHSMQPNIVVGYMFMRTTKEIWDAVQNVADAKIYTKLIEKQRVFQFLAGLNSEFEYARVHILNREPFPNLNEAYSSVLSDESRRSSQPSLV
ncbi:hypothetical protein AQUCO_01000658v1 [Aquilegia coerulea]|uniref:Retrotransposon Copia-like N-terminal domain-containing protein n=1 Tax=Aquilegia coerulea TaxID=218851 RepID=A0A2G5EB01_AQUCA|nr:hypothetical protein AQUCO_01000658v1 [Aquilegia coerulea]